MSLIPHLPQVVKVVLVMNPFVFRQETVGLIGDVLHIQTHTVIKLPFEELEHTHTYIHTHVHICISQCFIKVSAAILRLREKNNLRI